MSRTKKQSIPSYCLHKATRQAYVKLNGKRHYLGEYGTLKSKQKYHELVYQWDFNGRTPIVPDNEIYVLDLIDQYYTWACTYYRKPNGELSSQVQRIRNAVIKLKEIFGYSLVSDFTPRHLKIVRQGYIDKGLSRTTINGYISVIKHCFKWGVEEGLVAPEVFGAINVIAGLRKGRSEAKENAPISTISEDIISATTTHTSRQVTSLIWLQLYTGARPGELLDLRPIDIDTSGDIWSFQPARHKTQHHGIQRSILFGKRAQAILTPFLRDRPVHRSLFSPIEAEEQRHLRAKTHRRPNQQATPTISERTLGNVYTIESYRRAIHRACAKAGVTQWSPNQLRHTAATRIRAEYGLEAAQVILGHSKADVTQVYAERDSAKAISVIKIIG